MIQLTNLSRRFERGQTDIHALRGVDLTIEAGEFVALVGPSGSGKSTLLNLLGGLDRPSEGELWFNGKPLHSAGEQTRAIHRRQHIGFVFQSFNLLPRLTAQENVAVPLMLAGIPAAERNRRAQQLLAKVGLERRLDHYPAELSGGEQQRVAIARALIHNPSLLLADEPTGNLDSATGQTIMNLLKQLNEEQAVTLIVVTHDEEVAAYAGRTIKLRDGQITAVTANRPAVEVAPPAAPAVAASGELTLSDMFLTAVRNLGRRRVRNFLTAAGVLIGIVTLVAMVSFGVGVQREVQRNFEMVGLENIFVSPGLAQRDDFDPFAAGQPETPLTPQLAEELLALPEVVAVTPALTLPPAANIVLSLEEREIPVRVAGGGATPFTFGPPARSALLAGRSPADSGAGTLLSRGLADQLLAPGQGYEDLLGRPVNLTVTLPRGESAIFASQITGVRDGFAQRSIDLGIAERTEIVLWWFDDPGRLETQGYDQLVVEASSLGAVALVSDYLTDRGLQVQSLEAILELANQVLSLLQALLGSVGGLALLVAALGVANTMMMAIYERTREIGVLKALGASRGQIRLMFTIEAALIGLIGGFFGLILGTLLGRLVDWIAQQYLIREGVTGVGALSIVPAWLAIGALFFAALVGLLAGLYPAARAARLDPVTALRHEG